MFSADIHLLSLPVTPWSAGSQVVILHLPSIPWVISNKQHYPCRWKPVEGRRSPSITGNDGISSISCIPACCCANSTDPMRWGRIEIRKASLFTHHPSGRNLRQSRARWHVAHCAYAVTGDKVCLFSTSSLSLSALSQSGWGLSQVGGLLKINWLCLCCSRGYRGIFWNAVSVWMTIHRRAGFQFDLPVFYCFYQSKYLGIWLCFSLCSPSQSSPT